MAILEQILDIPAEHQNNVFGSYDSYAKNIEKTLNVTLVARDNGIKLIGDDTQVVKASRVINQLIELSRRGNEITEQQVNYALSLTFEEKEEVITEIDKDLVCRTIAGKPIKPKTLGQKKYVDNIREKMIVFGVGPAGTGKTYIAVAMAVNALKNKDVEKLILA
ncbi:MAG: PhoH family protein, partial [Lachnospiraceae bacterium]|nr:PhoH family protein [Lachnospiraceae bacterium]